MTDLLTIEEAASTENKSAAKWALELGVSAATISRARSGDTYRWVTQ